MAEDADIDLEAEGLYGMSYDSFFAIDKRVRKIQDMPVPTRAGLTVPQIGTFFIVLFISFFLYVFGLGQLLSLLGISLGWMGLVFFVFGPPILCSWRVTRPMPHGKSIPGTVQSYFRYYLDDEVHRRGRPVPPEKRPLDEPVQHYLRYCVVAEEFAAEVPVEGDWTDPHTEMLFARAVDSPDLQSWMDAKAVAHFEAASEDKTSHTEHEITVHDRRGRAATVIEL